MALVGLCDTFLAMLNWRIARWRTSRTRPKGSCTATLPSLMLHASVMVSTMQSEVYCDCGPWRRDGR